MGYRGIIYFLCLFCLAESIYSQPKSKKLIEDFISVGAAGFYSSSEYKGEDDNLLVVPSIGVKVGGVTVRGFHASYYEKFNKKFSIGADLIFDWISRNRSKAQALQGMDRRKNPLFLGVGASYLIWPVLVSTRLQYDLIGESNGVVTSLDFSTFVPLQKKLYFKPEIGVDFLSKKLSNFYYGVKSNEVMTGRPAYELDEIWKPYASLVVIYKVHPLFTVTGFSKYNFWLNNISDSPITEPGNKFTFGVAASFSWYFRETFNLN